MPPSRTVIKKVNRRILPLILVCYIVAFVDRTNIGVAALRMNGDLGLTMAAFGIASGVFFVGYAIFEVPSNLILHRVGARVWISRIMVAWGLLASATAFVTGPVSLYALRFLLGVAESGFFPGIILYFTYWLPRRERARAMAAMLAGIPVSFVLANPVSGWIVENGDLAGLTGWQVMFLVGGVPAMVLGLVVRRALPSGPAEARWLTDEERAWIVETLRADDERHSLSYGVRQVITSPRVLTLALISGGLVYATYTLNFFLPLVVQRLVPGLSAAGVGWVSAVPYLAAAFAMVAWARRSDRTGERIWHLILPTLVGVAGFALAFQTTAPVLALGAVTLAAMGIMATGPVFWTLPTQFLNGAAAAAAIGLINGLGHLAAIVGPFVTGLLYDLTGGFAAGFLVAAGYMAVCALLVGALGARSRKTAGADPWSSNRVS